MDGGMTTNNLLMQVQADLLDVQLTVPSVCETTALGAAFIAGIGAGLWPGGGSSSSAHGIATDMQHLRCLHKEGKHWEPSMSVDCKTHLLRQWQKAVHRSLGWAKKRPRGGEKELNQIAESCWKSFHNNKEY